MWKWCIRTIINLQGALAFVHYSWAFWNPEDTRAEFGFGKQAERCQGPQICILTIVHVSCLSRSPTLWTKKCVMIIQTLPPETGSILLPELLSIRTTSGASSITARKELKESTRVWHILWGVIVSPREIFGRSHYRVLIQISCFFQLVTTQCLDNMPLTNMIWGDACFL